MIEKRLLASLCWSVRLSMCVSAAAIVRISVEFYIGGFFNTVIPRLTKIIRFGITFVSRNLR